MRITWTNTGRYEEYETIEEMLRIAKALCMGGFMIGIEFKLTIPENP